MRHAVFVHNLANVCCSEHVRLLPLFSHRLSDGFGVLLDKEFLVRVLQFATSEPSLKYLLVRLDYRIEKGEHKVEFILVAQNQLIILLD